jgi:hypothetical protein
MQQVIYILVYLCSVAALKQRSCDLGKHFSKLSVFSVLIESYAQLKRISKFERRLVIVGSCMNAYRWGLDW